jgi:hypothetical protein
LDPQTNAAIPPGSRGSGTPLYKEFEKLDFLVLITSCLFLAISIEYPAFIDSPPADGMVRVAKGDIGVAAATTGFSIFGPVRLS